ncbi:hypothetical protein HDV00_002385 [Rhizophlyctis rosea]|nr:hypothetical protein HDV00_002385 [Rhizophlyctis rosea]
MTVPLNGHSQPFPASAAASAAPTQRRNSSATLAATLPPLDEHEALSFVPSDNPTSPTSQPSTPRRLSIPDGQYGRGPGFPDARLGAAVPIPAIDPQMANAMGLDPFAAAAATVAYNEALALRAGMLHPQYPHPAAEMSSRMLYAQAQAQGYAHVAAAAAAAAAAGIPNAASPATIHPHPLMMPHPLAAAAAAGQLPRGYPYPPAGYYPAPPIPIQNAGPGVGRLGMGKRGDLSIHTSVKPGSANGPVSAPAMMRGPPGEDGSVGWNEDYEDSIPGSVTGPLSPYGVGPLPGPNSHLPPRVDQSLKKLSLYKTELCRSWEETGYCRYASKCQFAHSESELRPVDRHPKYKTEMCKTFWEKGTCPYGKRCCFIHTERDVSGASASSAGGRGGMGGRKDEKGNSIKSPSGVTSPTSMLSPTSSASGIPRRRTTSMGSVLSYDGEDTATAEYYGSSYTTSPQLPPASLDMPMAYGSMPNLSGLPASQFPLSPASYVYDHRAIAEAYFAGRRFSDVGVVHGTFERRVSDVGLVPGFGDGGLARVEEEDGDDRGDAVNGTGMLTPVSFREDGREDDGRVRRTSLSVTQAVSTPLKSSAAAAYPLTPPLSNPITPTRSTITSASHSAPHHHFRNDTTTDAYVSDMQFPFDFEMSGVGKVSTGGNGSASSGGRDAGERSVRRTRSVTQPVGGGLGVGFANSVGSPPSRETDDMARLTSSVGGLSLSSSYGGSLSAGSSPLGIFTKRSGSFSGYLPGSVPSPSISLLSKSAGSPFMMGGRSAGGIGGRRRSSVAKALWVDDDDEDDEVGL